MKTYECRDCKAEFGWWTGQPGRPPVRCEACRAALKQVKEKKAVEVKTKLTPQEQVEQLELMLKSRNLHISQHRDKYE